MPAACLPSQGYRKYRKTIHWLFTKKVIFLPASRSKCGYIDTTASELYYVLFLFFTFLVLTVSMKDSDFTLAADFLDD